MKKHLKLTMSIIVDDVFEKWILYNDKFANEKLTNGYLKQKQTNQHVRQPSKIQVDDFSSLSNV
jgi:hypothetical protein